MTDSFEAPRHDQPTPKFSLNPGHPDLNVEGADRPTGLEDIYRDKYSQACEEIGPLPADSPCLKCVVGDPTQNPFYGYDKQRLPISVYEDRLVAFKRRYRKAYLGLCKGMVPQPPEVIRQIDPLPDLGPTKFERFVQIINPLLQKMGLTIELLELPPPKPAPRFVVVQPSPHCGQDPVIPAQH